MDWISNFLRKRRSKKFYAISFLLSFTSFSSDLICRISRSCCMRDVRNKEEKLWEEKYLWCASQTIGSKLEGRKMPFRLFRLINFCHGGGIEGNWQQKLSTTISFHFTDVDFYVADNLISQHFFLLLYFYLSIFLFFFVFTS